MSQLRQHRASRQDGFTLIELLVVILIIGILAAVAIPTFLSQTGKASDSNVQSALGTVHTSEVNYRLTNGGFTTSVSALTAIEPSLTAPAANDAIAISYYAASGPATALTGYQAQGTDTRDNVTFYLKYDLGSGAVTKTCSAPNTGACSATGTWGS